LNILFPGRREKRSGVERVFHVGIHSNHNIERLCRTKISFIYESAGEKGQTIKAVSTALSWVC
jgi:hypothetical protein